MTTDAAAAERSRLWVAIRHAIPVDKPWRGEALDLIYRIFAEVPDTANSHKRNREAEMSDQWECEDCGWPWPLPEAPQGGECDNCGGEMVCVSTATGTKRSS